MADSLPGQDEGMKDVLIVGAGVAGLSAARALKEAGLDVTVLEKSRGLGGRAATRRLHGNRVDHGAQYFTARDPRFKAQVAHWRAAGEVRVWSRGFHRLDDSGLTPPDGGHERYIFPTGMNRIGKLLAEDIDVRFTTRATNLHQNAKGWRLETDTGEAFEAEHIIVNMPARQALELCGDTLEPDTLNRLSDVTFHPCFALMLGFERDLAPEWQGITVGLEHSPLAWIAHDSDKRERPEHTVLVVHSTHSYAADNFETPLADVEQEMLAALTEFDNRFAKPLWTNMQRWRYALAKNPLDEPCFQQDTLYLCGDWCGGDKLEAAYLSGLAVAQTLLPTGKIRKK